MLDGLRSAVGRSGVNTRSPRYLAYLPSGGLHSAALADFLASVLNPYSALATLSPGAAGLEEQVVGWLCGVVGLPAGASGVLTSGGSTATLTAVVATRERAGFQASAAARFVVYVGGHHSVDRALRFTGLGECPVRVVPSAAGHRMDVAVLARPASVVLHAASTTSRNPRHHARSSACPYW